MPKLLKFVCPHCGKDTYVQERVEGVTQYNSVEMYANGVYHMTFEDSDDWDEHPRNSRTFRYLCGHCSEDLLPESSDCYEARRKLYEYLLKLPCNHEIGEGSAEG